jgi:colicin import membrane protein
VNIDFREAGRQVQAFGLAIAVHVLAALFVVMGTIEWVPFRQEQPVGLLIEAVIVDTSELEEQRQAARQAVEREEMLEQRTRELEQQREREQQRQRDLEEQRRQQQIEEQRQREADDRLEQIRREREARLEAERLKQQRELEQIREQREAAERQRQQEAERLKQLEAIRNAEREQQLAAEAEAQRQALEQQAFQSGRLATEREKYMLTIQQIVTQNWLRPPTAQAGLRCEVNVIQIPGGEVISANVGSPCNADPVTRRSITAAVERVGTLPYRGFEDVFEREITFQFIYDGE